MHLPNSKFNNLFVLKKLIFVVFLIIISSFSIKVKAQQTAQRDTDGMGYLEYLPPGYNDNNDSYPVIIFLHGFGERGDGSPSDLEKVKKHGPPKYIQNGHNMCFEYNGVEECFIVLSPQQFSERGNWLGRHVNDFIDNVIVNYRIDPSRVYLMGLSMGGRGTWSAAYDDTNVPNKFAAISVAAGTGDYQLAQRLAANKTPVWAFHGTNDNQRPLYEGERPIRGMNAVNADPAPIFTVYEGVGHNSWDRAFRTDNSLHNPNVYQWFLAQGGSGNNGNTVPTAPSNLITTFTGNNSLKLSWKDNSDDETNFKIERSLNSSSNFSIINTTSSNITDYEDINLQPNVQYYYRISAKNNNGNSSYSNILSVTTFEDVPTENQNVMIIDNNHSSVSTTGIWSKSVGDGISMYENDYLHDRDNWKGEKKVTIDVDLEPGTYEVFAWWYAKSNRATNTPFEIKSIEGTTIIYKNQRLNNAQWVSLGTYEFASSALINISNGNTNGFVVFDAIKFVSNASSGNNSAPTAPSNLSDNFTGTNKINLNWSDNSTNETNFLIERSLNSNSNFEVSQSTGSNVTNYEDNNLSPNTQYYYRIRAKNNNGSSSYSNKLSAKTDEVLPQEPQGVTIIDNNHSSVSTTGIWSKSIGDGISMYENDYLHDRDNWKGGKKVTIDIDLEPGTYEVFAWWYAKSNRATNTPFEIQGNQGNTIIYKNQRINNAQWVSLGTYEFSSNALINISNENTNGFVVFDAIKFVSSNTTTTSRQNTNMEELEMNTLENIAVFPNPMQNTFSIRSPFDETKVFHLRMRGKSGQIEWEQTVQGVGELRFDINRAYIDAGIKYLSIEVEGQPIKIMQILLL